MEFQRMSESEKEVMQLVWRMGGPVLSAQLQGSLKKRNKAWKPTTMLTFLARLTEKGLLTSKRHGRANEYIPLVTEAEYRRFETRLFINSVHEGSVKSFIATLFDGGDLTQEEIMELQDWFSQGGGNK